MGLGFAAPVDGAIPITLTDADGAEAAIAALPAPQAAWAGLNGFTGKLGQSCVLPDPEGAAARVLIGTGDAASRARQRFAAGAAIAALPAGTYRIEGETDAETGLGYLLAGYRFDRYTAKPASAARLIAPEGLDTARLELMANAEALTRDLINTPAEDMGPDALEDATRALADEFGAQIEVTTGDALLAQNFPLIHTVGRAAARAPRLIDMRLGQTGPAITLVGKGVCFDTGGLNLKPGASMGLMKKDMGGAANVLGLARMIMASGLECRLRVLIPAVENAVAGNAFRPGDVFTARNGMTVEINNTDAEGRLVLADALALAVEGEAPDLLVSMATLTGAARVALGPDLAPFFTDDESLAAALSEAAGAAADPVWRLPFHAPYEAKIEPDIADLDNAPAGGMAGAITAALFLRRFTDGHPSYLHFDIYGWTPSAAPARPIGGAMQGARAVFGALPGLLGA